MHTDQFFKQIKKSAMTPTLKTGFWPFRINYSGKTTSPGQWQIYLDQGKWQEGRQKCITPQEVLLKLSQTDVSALHTVPGASSGALRVTTHPWKM